MVRFLLRSIYRCLVRLHPPSFQAQFADEMLWIYAEEEERQGAVRFLADGFLSLARQWIVRCAWKLVADSLFSDTPCHDVRYTSVPVWRPWRDF
jgi:hypothetical protein